MHHHKSLKTLVFPGKTICFHKKNNLFSTEKQLVFNGKTTCFQRKNNLFLTRRQNENNITDIANPL